jgi:thioredoxin reductase
MHDPEVLIVGAGPAGLGAAIELASRGIKKVLIIDRDDAPGGLPRFCSHPGFGIGYLAVPRSGPVFTTILVRKLETSGGRILCGTTLLAIGKGPTATITGPEVGYRTLYPRAVLFATGVREANRGNRVIPGDRPAAGIMTTGLLQQMVARGVQFPPYMKSLVVVGTEHVSFSVLWTARHAGMRVRMLIDERSEVASYAAAGWLARLGGTEIRLQSRVAAIEAVDDRVSAVVVERYGTRESVACDGVVFSAGWIPEVGALLGGPLDVDASTGGMVVDEQGNAGIRGFFAAGNVCHPVKASGACARQGKHVGTAIARYLSTNLT